MNIKIIGTHCSNGMKLLKAVSKALEQYRGTNTIELLDNQKHISRYNVSNIPALVINEKVVSEGKVLTEREICKLMNHVCEY